MKYEGESNINEILYRKASYNEEGSLKSPMHDKGEQSGLKEE